MKIFTLYALIALSLNACASIPLEQAVTGNTKNLPPQHLESGECGLFFWTKTSPRNFVFFHKNGQQQAKYFSKGSKASLVLSRGTLDPSKSSTLDIEYKNSQSKSVYVKGTYTEDIESGVRIPNGRIITQNDEGWQEIIPVSGIFVCQSAGY